MEGFGNHTIFPTSTPINTEDLEMKVTEQNVNSLFGNRVQYKIPLFQRHYVWDEEDQWKPLWNDIKSRFSQQDTHFTGTLVIQEENQSGNGKRSKNEIYEIIDGQQRLTTFQIIFCVFRDLAKEIKYEDLEDEANRYILNRSLRTPRDRDERYKLIPKDLDKESFLQLVDSDVDESSGRIRDAYNYFKTAIADYVQKDRDKMFNLFETISDNFGFVQILIDSADEPEKIFESLNARGKRLLQFDLLRNNLFLRAHQDRDRLYKKYWDHFESPYWNPEEKSGTSSEVFLQHFLMAKLGEERVKPEFNIYQRQYRPKIEGTDTIEDEFSELQSYSEVYQEMTDCKDDSKIGQRMKFYNTFDLTTLHPFILFAKCEVGLSNVELDYVFDILESYTLRRMLCCRGKRGLLKFNIFFSELISELRSNFRVERFIQRLSAETSNTNRYPTDDEIGPALHTKYDEHTILFPDDSTIVFPDNRTVKAALHGLWAETAGAIRVRLIRYILYRIELMKMREDKFAEPLVFRDSLTTLEHVMPNEWKETWHLPIADGSVIYEESNDNLGIYVNRETKGDYLIYEKLFSDSYKEENPGWKTQPARNGLAKDSYSNTFQLALARDHLLQSIGNLTLVTRELNAKLGNRTFPKKREALRKHSGLKLNNEICQHNMWDVNEIHARAEKLIADVCRIWPSLEWFAENIP